MAADQRLDQLEPLISEALTVLDRHTVQLKRLENTVAQSVTILTQHSETLSFLLQEHIIIKNDVAEIKTDVAEIKVDVAGLKTDVAEIKSMQAGFDSKLDLILSKL